MIYFDNSATTKIDPSVLATYRSVSEQYYGNPSSLHQLGEQSRQLLTQSRKQIAELLDVSKEEIYFTSGGTEGDNLAIKGTAIEKMDYGRHIITSSTEHPAVIQSMEQLEALGWDVTYLSVDEKGQISLEELEQSLRKDTVLVSLMAVNNETGSLQPLKEVGELLELYPSVHFHVDAVQAIGKIDLDLNESRIDIAVFSGHKFHAPKGTGFIYVKSGRKLAPLLSGGGQETGLRNGTENVPGNVALAKSLRLLMENKEETAQKLLDMRKSLLAYFADLDRVTVFSPEESAPHIVCFGIKNIKGEVVVHALEKHGIYISTTSACSSRKKDNIHSIREMGYSLKEAESAVRISWSQINTLQEVDAFKSAVDTVYSQLKSIE
ncbi:cysteine desulfurase family protein [Alkalibacterium putridalgicola]|uniref:Aminotransferase V n=1 Tax=Alkalibacterium putridalgicola TaxID=426703 RepID=A0A1H7QBM5_9LACT|nr:cysteine desulfurase family protein [Alkalibacterium putridalgicola]GEK87964.1 aminotransferase V [Alkalibacterium putridalgicola]SEL45561.1 cysteine desulfurase [Alkalibacterium putridalgicola]